jgi:hypothetical protein
MAATYMIRTKESGDQNCGIDMTKMGETPST